MIGSIFPFAGSSIPSGYLLCDGSAISRTTYSELFSVIGDTFGPGDGSTTFNLPDLGGRVPIGQSSGHVLGTSGGESEHQLQSTEIPAHIHSIPAHGHTNNIAFNTPKLTHTITAQPAFTYTRCNATESTGAAQAGNSYTGRVARYMTRSTNVAITDHPATACTMSGAVTDCAALTSSDAGTGTAHNNMMPYITLPYIIFAGV